MLLTVFLYAKILPLAVMPGNIRLLSYLRHTSIRIPYSGRLSDRKQPPVPDGLFKKFCFNITNN